MGLSSSPLLNVGLITPKDMGPLHPGRGQGWRVGILNLNLICFLVLFWHPSPPPVTHLGVIPASETSRLLRPEPGEHLLEDI